MIPWLVLSALGFVCDCSRVIITVIVGFVTGVGFSAIVYTFLLNAVGCGMIRFWFFGDKLNLFTIFSFIH